MEKKSYACDNCPASCCKHIAMEIDAPTDIEDFEDFKWYLAHKNVQIYVEVDGTWNIEFLTPCEHLDEKNRCKIYDKRPQICRDYKAEDCVFHNEYEELQTFKCLEDLEVYIEKIFKRGLHTVKDEDEEE